jgi:hypothetical protein
MDVLGRGDGDSVGCTLVVKGPWVPWVSVTRPRGVCELDVHGRGRWGVWTRMEGLKHSRARWSHACGVHVIMLVPKLTLSFDGYDDMQRFVGKLLVCFGLQLLLDCQPLIHIPPHCSKKC